MFAPAPGATAAQELETVILRNARGDSAVILNLGARLVEFNINTRSQGQINTVLGYHHIHSYLKDSAFHGAVVGRYCNRIANSRFSLGSETYQLASNEGAHQLHGGPGGFSSRLWELEQRDESSVNLKLISPDGDQGYPGNLEILLRYVLDDDSGLELTWRAGTDCDTVVSLSSHAYFNLAGHGDIGNHLLRIPASHYTPTGPDMIPSGELCPVGGSSLDFQDFVALEQVLTSEAPEIAPFGGLDHNWARGSEGQMLLSAELLCAESGLLLQASSTLPGLQCYTGNQLLSNGIHGCHEGICLEPQYYPDSPNVPTFPSPLLRAGASMEHRIRYRLSEVDGRDRLARGCGQD